MKGILVSGVVVMVGVGLWCVGSGVSAEEPKPVQPAEKPTAEDEAKWEAWTSDFHAKLQTDERYLAAEKALSPYEGDDPEEVHGELARFDATTVEPVMDVELDSILSSGICDGWQTCPQSVSDALSGAPSNLICGEVGTYNVCVLATDDGVQVQAWDANWAPVISATQFGGSRAGDENQNKKVSCAPLGDDTFCCGFPDGSLKCVCYNDHSKTFEDCTLKIGISIVVDPIDIADMMCEGRDTSCRNDVTAQLQPGPTRDLFVGGTVGPFAVGILTLDAGVTVQLYWDGGDLILEATTITSRAAPEPEDDDDVTVDCHFVGTSRFCCGYSDGTIKCLCRDEGHIVWRPCGGL